MPALRLTAAFSDSVKPIGGQQTAYPDTDVRGLELRVSGDGRKTWTFRYRSSRWPWSRRSSRPSAWRSRSWSIRSPHRLRPAS